MPIPVCPGYPACCPFKHHAPSHVHMAQAHQAQAPQTTQVREPGATKPATKVQGVATKVPDVVESSATKVEGAVTNANEAPKMGRPRVYATDAERYRAYRQRKRAQSQAGEEGDGGV
jgi:hypothetical protein